MTKNNKLVSVIIPVYNGEKYLQEAIETVINQTYKPLEIIIVDDGSTDQTANIVKNFSQDLNLYIYYIYQPNSGPAVARNTGIKKAKGDYIAFLDADDLWDNQHLQILLRHFEEDLTLEVVTGRTQVMLLKKKELEQDSFVEFSKATINVNLGSSLYKKSVFEKLGYLDAKLRHGEDVDWFMRIKEAGINKLNIEEITLYYRLHEHNISGDRTKSKSGFIKALKMSLERKRKMVV